MLINILGWMIVGFGFVIFVVEVFQDVPVNIVRAYHKKRAIKKSYTHIEFEQQDLYMNRFRTMLKNIRKPMRAVNFILTDLQIIYYLLFVGFAVAGLIAHPFLFVFHLSLIIIR